MRESRGTGARNTDISAQALRGSPMLAQSRPNNGKFSADDLAQLKEIEKYRQKKLSAMLSGPEFDQMELSMSPTAVRIAKSRVLTRLRAEAGELID